MPLFPFGVIPQMANRTTKMLTLLWKGRKNGVFEEPAAFQEHVSKHGPEQKDAGTVTTETEEEEEMPMIKMEMHKAEMKMRKEVEVGRRKPVCLAIEVWVDVFGFIKRIQLARTVSLTSRFIYQICWSRLHGNRVKAHKVYEIVIGNRDEFGGRPPTAVVLKDGTEMPLVSWPLPEYITGIFRITINFLDEQVLELLTHIFPRRVAANMDQILLSLCLLKELDEKQRAFVHQLLDIFCNGLLKQIYLYIKSPMASLQLLRDIDNKVEQKICVVVKEKWWDIPVLMQMLATPRTDGQQRVMRVSFDGDKQVAQEMLYAIKKEFHASTQRLPQPFYIRLSTIGGSFVKIVEENQQTDETLISFNVMHGYGYEWDICRHPKDQHEQLAEDGRKRLKWTPNMNLKCVSVKF